MRRCAAALLGVACFYGMLLLSSVSHFSIVCCFSASCHTIWQHAAALLNVTRFDSVLLLCFLSHNSSVYCCSARYPTFQQYASALLHITHFGRKLLLCPLSHISTVCCCSVHYHTFRQYTWLLQAGYLLVTYWPAATSRILALDVFSYCSCTSIPLLS